MRNARMCYAQVAVDYFGYASNRLCCAVALPDHWWVWLSSNRAVYAITVCRSSGYGRQGRQLRIITLRRSIGRSEADDGRDFAHQTSRVLDLRAPSGENPFRGVTEDFQGMKVTGSLVRLTNPRPSPYCLAWSNANGTP